MFHTVRPLLIEIVRYGEITRLEGILNWTFKFLREMADIMQTNDTWVLFGTQYFSKDI